VSLRKLVFGDSEELSLAELELLSRFLHPKTQDSFGNAEYWRDVTGVHPNRIIKRLLNDGLLERADVTGALEFICKVSDLKELLRQRGLPLSGRKRDLIERLVAADPGGMENVVKGIVVLRCSKRGDDVVRKYLEEKDREREAAYTSTRDALKRKDFGTACRVVGSYEAKQLFPRGLGVDWAHYDPTEDIAVLREIAQARPKIIGQVDETILEPLRLAAGMSLLWGTNVRSDWLPQDIGGELRLEPEVSTRMILFYARNRRTLLSFKRMGVRRVEISSPCGCECCATLQGKTYPTEDVPELPYEKCTFNAGCRCLPVAADLGMVEEFLG
jgi:hypothetical protein